ncbi:MAG: GGDEF domain-containing phosphodiesterase [Pseudomonadota bacterium]
MLKGSFQTKSLIELFSIAGIMAFFFWMDRNFGILNWITEEFFITFPGIREYSMNLAGVGFVGLVVYSIMLRVRGRQERIARATLEKLLQQKDFIDPSTGLSNRLGFKLMLGELRKSEVMTRKAILAFEIRNLDSIASVHGEKTSSRIEAIYGEQIALLCRENDFAGRTEKGRFYLLINSADEDENKHQIDRVVDAVQIFSDKGISVEDLTMSIHLNSGVLDLHSHKKLAEKWDEEDIVQRLDFMLHCSRSSGHEILETYDGQMEKSLSQRALVECELLGAISSGQIVPYFQPFIDMKTNKVIGLEILARWEHPEQGFIPPDIFVQIAEEIGATKELTLSMLRQACEAAAHWPEEIKLAFNISPNELHSDTTIDAFFKILKSTGVSSDRIEIEITEHAFIEEVGEITDAVAKLKNSGIQISIDDFGTGYSNLKHLKLLPFDKIKIDQSFIRDMSSNTESRAIVRNVIALGKSLGLPTIAEGIELDQNRELLQELGCSVGQGYFFAKALRADDVMKFIENYQQEVSFLHQAA